MSAEEDGLSVFRRGGEAFGAFSVDETSRLRTFTRLAVGLAGLNLASWVPQSITLGTNGPSTELDAVDDYQVRAAVTYFRSLYIDTEPSSFAAVLKLLHGSARRRNSEYRDAALTVLSRLKAASGSVSSTLGIEHRISTPSGLVVLSGHDIIDSYLHGEYLHVENDKTKRVHLLDLSPVGRFQFLNALERGSSLYAIGAEAVGHLLADPRLVDARAPTAPSTATGASNPAH